MYSEQKWNIQQNDKRIETNNVVSLHISRSNFLSAALQSKRTLVGKSRSENSRKWTHIKTNQNKNPNPAEGVLE